MFQKLKHLAHPQRLIRDRWGRPIAVSFRFVLLVALLSTMLNPLASAQTVRADDNEPETSWLMQAISTIDGFFPTSWSCGGAAPAPQSILQFHRNWHCTNPDHSGPNWGNRFFGFHKQFLLGFNRYRAANGFPYIQTWVPSPGALIPPAHGGRPANTPCPTCVALPNQFRLPAAGGTLDSFTSVTAIGDAIVGWHNTNHGRIGQSGGTGCVIPGQAPQGDMSCVAFSPRDPIFYRYHHNFDDVQNAWRTHQPTDIMIVFDRSGSMGLPAVGAPTRLEAARSAANLFTDLLEDGTSHRVGMVSFSTGASAPADLLLTAIAAAPAAMNGALAGLSAGGSTSIGAGLQQAQATLAAGGNPRKAILLLTDGMENNSPMIADVQAGLGDTHLCAVGFGTPGSLDGPKLRDLAERQGGIYVSGPGALELRKFFVDCFADIFDSFVGEDPIESLPAGQTASNPLIHVAQQDEKITFVLSWSNPTPKGGLRLEVFTPAGNPVDLADPIIESSYGDSWHIVRIRLPYQGEGDGKWIAQAVRGEHTFANGFTGNAFVDAQEGTNLVRAQLRYLCPDGCTNVLYYEDEMAMGEESTFDEHSSVYADALFNEVPSGTVTNITRVRQAEEFAERLKRGGFDLLVYASKEAREQQPYDSILARTLCAANAPRAIISDNRQNDAARRIFNCVGVEPTDNVNWQELIVKGFGLEGAFKLNQPAHAHVPFSYSLKPIANNGAAQATNEQGDIAILGNNNSQEDQQYFISALTRAPARVLPFAWISNYYTGESLHPTFQIPEPYWPEKGYESVKALVQVTRPLRGLGELAAEVGVTDQSQVNGDLLDPRQSALLKLDPEQTGEIVPTETLEFELFDDGSNGDGTANDHYWEASLPDKLAEFDGQYRFHAIFELCRDGLCVQREAEQTVVVESKLDREKTRVEVEHVDDNRIRILVTPMDNSGHPLGPGKANTIQVVASCPIQVERSVDLDGKGTYEFVVSWSEQERPSLSLAQFGRPGERIPIQLP